MDSFEPYLHTNYAPSDLEKVQIQRLLVKPREELEAIDRELAELQERTAILTAKREERARYIEDRTALLSLIRNLPLEILRTIFLLCTDAALPFPDRRDTTPMTVKEAPLLLTYVCRHWRQVALEYPALWENPRVLLPWEMYYEARPLREAAERRAQLFRLWASRAAKRYLTISIISSYTHSTDEHVRPLIDSILSVASQWRRLRLQLSSELLAPFFALPSSSVPNLQHIDIQSPPGFLSLYHLHNGPFSMLNGPEIRAVLLTGLSSSYTLDMPFRWSQLTSLYLKKLNQSSIRFSDEDVFILLTQCPLLERCQLYISTWVPAHPFDEHLVLHHLRYLDIDIPPPAIKFISWLELPALKSLKISTATDGDTLISVIGRFSATLRHLTMCTSKMSTQELVHILTQTSLLESLELSYQAYAGPPVPFMTDTLIDALTPKMNVDPIPPSISPSDQTTEVDAGDLCPNLQHFVMKIAVGPRVSDAAILRFIKARREASPLTLRSVVIVHLGYPPELDVVGELERNGVDIRFMDIDLQYQTRRGVLDI